MFLRKTSHLRSLYRALIVTARSLGYKYKLVSSDTGKHFGYPNQEKAIHIGRDQPLTDKVILLAHEIGHGLDLSYNPFPVNELVEMLINWDTYETGRIYYKREKAAWKHAKDTLSLMGGFKLVKPRFQQLRKRGLSAYYRRMIKAQNGNTTANSR